MLEPKFLAIAMIINTSAILAILNLESEAEVFTNAIANDPIRLLSAGTALELSIILKARKEEAGIRELIIGNR